MGPGKLIDPSKFSHVFCSPRVRAQRTLDMLLGDKHKEALVKEGKLTITEDTAERDYGDYEGSTPIDIRTKRKEQGFGHREALGYLGRRLCGRRVSPQAQNPYWSLSS